MKVVVFDKSEWDKYAEKAHLICFKSHYENKYNKYDFAIIVESDSGEILSYTTIVDISEDECYMKHGGAFPSSKGTTASFATYLETLGYLKSKYKKITTLIENKNHTMIKFAMKVGFNATGIRYYDNSILIEHTLEVF